MHYFKHDSKRRILLLHRNIRRMNRQLAEFYHSQNTMSRSPSYLPRRKSWACDRWQLYWFLILGVWVMTFYRSVDISKTLCTRTRETTFVNVRRSVCARAVYYHSQEYHLFRIHLVGLLLTNAFFSTASRKWIHFGYIYAMMMFFAACNIIRCSWWCSWNLDSWILLQVNYSPADLLLPLTGRPFFEYPPSGAATAQFLLQHFNDCCDRRGVKQRAVLAMAGQTAGRFGCLRLLRKCGSLVDPTDTRNRSGAGGDRPTVSVVASGAGESRQPAIASWAVRGAHSGAWLRSFGLGSTALHSFAPKLGWICLSLRLELNIGEHLPRCAIANMADSSRAGHECQVETLHLLRFTPLAHAERPKRLTLL